MYMVAYWEIVYSISPEYTVVIHPNLQRYTFISMYNDVYRWIPVHVCSVTYGDGFACYRSLVDSR